jgi:hypothetical protein
MLTFTAAPAGLHWSRTRGRYRTVIALLFGFAASVQVITLGRITGIALALALAAAR